jgi:hypothetical protein
VKNQIKIIMTFMMLAVFITGCNSDLNTDNSISGKAEISSAKVEKIEVFHFHGNHQCASCIAVGSLAEETVNTYFADEVKSGKIIFGHINGELPENNDLVAKYGATGSSLWIGTYTKDGQFKAEQNVNVWYKINNKEEYMDYLKGVIEQKLSGE